MNDLLSLPGFQRDGAPAPNAPISQPAAPARPRLRPIDRAQTRFHHVDVERLIEEDHPARAIWALTGQLPLERFYEPIEAVQGVCGRTPWDPRLLMSLWIYAYSRGVSSAREIARRCEYEPGFQWLCALEKVNHHTLSDFRVRHHDALQELFVQLLAVLSAEGLVSLERVMHDGTKIRAEASRQSFRREDALREQLAAARRQVEELSKEQNEEATRHQAARQRAAREREERVQAALQQLEQMRAARFGKEKEEVRASTSDPECRVMKQAGGGYAPSYNVQISTEASHKIIVGVGVSSSGNDYAELTPAVAQIEENLGHRPTQVVADGGFTSRENIVNMAEQGIDFIGSLPDSVALGAGGRTQYGRSADFAREAFEYDAARDSYRCPAGETLRATTQSKLPGAVQHAYRASAAACQSCRFKNQCCPQNTRRTLVRVVEEPVVQSFREKMQTEEARQIYTQRAEVAEFPHAWLKEKLGLRRFRVRGKIKVRCETLWACLTYNIQQWIRLNWLPQAVAA